ncbi:hypothetical protein ASZ90_014990 [hydrocarbon metagenome]|uniref:Uncharacterized protein n=1 Tax=hydrocarbon metagenome TaxID=938273 RepID=A0A0W8F3B0_9ZZZZ
MDTGGYPHLKRRARSPDSSYPWHSACDETCARIKKWNDSIVDAWNNTAEIIPIQKWSLA